MKNDIVKVSNLKAASLDVSISRLPFGCKFIVKLLNESVKEERQITRNDIVEAYTEYWMEKRGDLFEMDFVRDERNNLYWKKVTCSREQWYKRYGLKTEALTWFQRNLGMAIVRGKVLAIPIIEIDE